MATSKSLGEHEISNNGNGSREDGGKDAADEGLVKKTNKLLPWKIIYQNIQGLITENSKVKLDYLKEYSKENNILLMNFTETWLNKFIQKDTKINGYQIFRGDRRIRKRGGTAIYLNDQYEARHISEMSVDKNELTAVYIEKLNTINMVIYRPPDTKLSAFAPILEKVKDILRNVSGPDPTIIITGDFNFPFIRWIRGPDNGCRWEIKPNTRFTNDEKEQFNRLYEIMDKNNLIQLIEEPTRERNTLDLVFTNEISMFTHTEVTKSSFSDHHLIELTTN
ncbi:unnamed protein product, partial [Meganyctiphanes norvegica]